MQPQPGSVVNGGVPKWLLNGAAVFILIVWGIVVTVDAFSQAFEAPLPIYGVAMAVVGRLYGVGLKK